MKYGIYMLLVMLIACNSKPTEDKSITTNSVDENSVTLTEAQSKQIEITTIHLQEGLLSSSIHVNGRIDVPPQNLVSVSLPLGGYLRQTDLLPGMEVRKGQLIGMIEDQQFIQLQQDYLLAKSKLHFSSLEYNRQKNLNESQASSNKVMQLAEADMQSQRIALSGLEEKLRLLQINPNTVSTGNIKRKIPLYSPIQGFVTKVNGNVGKYFSPSEVVFEIINPDDVHLNLKVYEKDLPFIHIGSLVETYTNNSAERFPASIILIGRDLTADGSTEVHCHFKQYPAHLAPGTYMNADIETANKKVNTIPEDCVVSFEGQDYIFIQLGPRQYRMLEVQTGAAENNQIEIKNLRSLAQKEIVQQGAYALLMKLKNKEE